MSGFGSMVINGRFLSQALTGVQRYAIEMTRAIRVIFPDIEVLAPRNILHRELAVEFDARILGKGTGYYWEQIELPARLSSRSSPPVLLNLANLAPLAYNRNVVVIHDVCPLRHPSWYSVRFRSIYRMALPRLAKRALGVITDSQFSAQEILELLPITRDKLAIVPCAVSSDFVNSRPDWTRKIQSGYILSVGSFDPRKNLPMLIQAFSKLQMPQLRLVIVGQANRVFDASARVQPGKSQGDVTVRSVVNDAELKDLYSHAAIFAFLSHYEGFGLPPLEAMACGCPCLLSTAACLPEVFGDSAVYCDPFDVEDIADKMRDLLLNEPLRMLCRERGLAKARSYSWSRSAQLLLNTIDRLVIS